MTRKLYEVRLGLDASSRAELIELLRACLPPERLRSLEILGCTEVHTDAPPGPRRSATA